MAANFSEILEEIKPLLKKYEAQLVVKKDTKGCYELWTGKPVTVAGRPYPELFFASVALQKNFVGFYYFPIYCKPELKEQLAAPLIKTLKGKSCFHIKNLDSDMLKHIDEALKTGLAAYKKQKWI